MSFVFFDVFFFSFGLPVSFYPYLSDLLGSPNLLPRTNNQPAAECIHPSQVSVVQEQFSPSIRDIIKSACLVVADEKAVALGKGSFGFSESMVDAPVSKKARVTLAIAQRLGVNVQQLKRDVDVEDGTMPDWNRRIGIIHEQQGLALRKTMGFDTDIN